MDLISKINKLLERITNKDKIKNLEMDIINTNKYAAEKVAELAVAKSKNTELSSQLLVIQKENADLKQLVIKLTPITTEETELEKFWNSKYNTGIITYPGRYLPTGEQISAPVNLLVTPNDPVMISDLKEWGLYRTGEDPETLIPKIDKKYYEKYYVYRLDKLSWGGKSEVWEYFYEMRENSRLKKEKKLPYDCDSHAQAKAGLYICAGVPRWRVRVVVGNTSIGAHSTNHIYSMVDYAWHHLNSTYGGTLYDRVSDYPKNSDAKNPETNTGTDIIGIYKIWFSFNDLYMWYDKVEDIPKELQVL